MKKKTLVLGASEKPDRYSNKAIRMLLNHEYEVVALGLRPGEVNGVKIDTGFPAYEGVDSVTLYLNPKRQQAYYDYILSLKPNRVVFNPGTENPEFYQLLTENKIEVEPACTLVMLKSGVY